MTFNSVPARLGKGQGAKEIGHNIARGRLKFGHNPARERNEVWTLLWPFDENMGTNLQAFYKPFYIVCLKTQKQQLHFVNKKNLNYLFIFLFGQGAV